MQIGKRTSANAVIKAVMSNANGIRESKSRERASSQLKGQNGHSISAKAHSIKSVQNLRSVTTQYINYLKENHSNKVVQHINKDTVKEFLLSKKINGGSLNTYISSMAKFAENVNKIGVDTLERKDLYSIRTEFRNSNINLQKNHISRAPNPNTIPQIIKNVQASSSYALSAKLQAYSGMRIDDATNSGKWKLNEDNSIHITHSKNGLNYTTIQLDDKTAQEVRNAIAEGYKIDKTQYSQVLKEAVEKTGQKYQGSHSMRYAFCQLRMAELREEYQYSFASALVQTSKEMAHSRERITLHYL